MGIELPTSSVYTQHTLPIYEEQDLLKIG